MIAATLAEQKRAKLKFFAAYIASVLLILVIIASFLQRNPPLSESATAVADPDAKRLMETDALLHNRMAQVDKAYADSFSGNNLSGDALKSLQAAGISFSSTLDSLSKEAALLKDENRKGEMNHLLENFKRSFETRNALMNGYTALLNDTIRNNSGGTLLTNMPATNDAALQELKNVLVQKEEKIAALEKQRLTELAEKDKTIASLQNQVSQRANMSVQTNTGGDSEWKQKYAKLKASYDNLAGQNNSLNKSYKAIVDDNRRLLSQLQSARKQ